MYAHEETITELGISKKDLPTDLQARIRTFTNKARLSKRPETLEQLEVESEDLADEVLGWFNNDSDDYEEDDDADYEDEMLEAKRLKREQDEAERLRLENEQRQTQSQQQQQNTPPPTQEIKEEPSGWGINTNW